MKPLSLSSPHLIIMVGIPGSGKTFFADHFAATFNAPVVSFEKIAAEIYGARQLERDEQATVVRVSHYLLKQLLKTNQTVIYEGITDTRTTRQALAKIANDQGYEPLLVWVQTESIASKIRATKSRREVATISPEQFDTVLKRFTPPNASERAVVISGKHTYASQLKIVLKRLADSHVEKMDTTIPGRTVEGRHITVR
jgi:predicted kinase